MIRDDYNKLRQYDPTRGYKLSSWIGLISTNAAHDALRKKTPEISSLESAESEWPDDEQPSPADLTLQKEQSQLLTQAIQHLSEGEKLFLRHYYQENMEPEEIAKLLGISINTVYSRKNKVRNRLRKIVENMEQG
ncbi:MAG: sigma-70 family RNA polymerase sigma factor [Pseudomonadota bacterium]